MDIHEIIAYVLLIVGVVWSLGPVALWIGKHWRYGTLRAERLAKAEEQNERKESEHGSRT